MASLQPSIQMRLPFRGSAVSGVMHAEASEICRHHFAARPSVVYFQASEAWRKHFAARPSVVPFALARNIFTNV